MSYGINYTAVSLQETFNKAVANPDNRYPLVHGFHKKSDEQTHNVNWQKIGVIIYEAFYENYTSKYNDRYSVDAFYDSLDSMINKYEATLPLWHD